MAIEILAKELHEIDGVAEFDRWVRSSLRLELPHAAFLVTVGRLYGVGSVPTHRLSVDFPLEIIEYIKNSSGALDDPSIFGWFHSQRIRFLNVIERDKSDGSVGWTEILLQFGLHGVLIHGVLDHFRRRFAIFQIFNPHGDGSQVNMHLLASLGVHLAETSWRVFFSKRVELIDRRTAIGHPTLSLTAAELHIVELLAQGLSNKEIARRRGVSDSTIKTQVQRTGAKVGATRRAEIVALALPFLSPLPPQKFIDYDD